MDLKSCSRCGKIHPRGYKRNVGGVYSGGEERKLRSKYAWEKKSKQIREDAHGLCELCFMHGKYTYNNLEVHHIVKLTEDPDGLLEDDNLICLCQEHHKQADAGQIDVRALREVAQLRILGKMFEHDFLYGVGKKGK